MRSAVLKFDACVVPGSVKPRILVRAVATVVAALASTASATDYVWDGDLGSDGVGPITNKEWNFWDAQSLGRYIGYEGGPPLPPGLNDSLHFGSGYASGRTVKMRGDRGIGTLYLGSGGGGDAHLADGRDGQTSALLINSGKIILEGNPNDFFGRTFTFDSSVLLFSTAPLTFSGQYMRVNVYGPVGGPSINIDASPSSVNFYGSVSTTSVNVSAGFVSFGTQDVSLDATQVHVGDGSGAAAQFEAYNGLLVGKNTIVESDGTLSFQSSANMGTLTLNGGTVNGASSLRSPYITASPGMLDGVAHASEMNSVSSPHRVPTLPKSSTVAAPSAWTMR